MGPGHTVVEAPHPLWLQEQPPIVARRTGLGMGRHHRAGWCRTPTRVRAEAWEPTATNSEEKERLLWAASPERRLSRFSAWSQAPPRLANLRQQARGDAPFPIQSPAQ